MKRGDWLVLSAIVTLIVLGSLPLLAVHGAGTVVITARSSEVYRAPLDIDAVVAAGPGNTVAIEKGAVRMLKADCADQICVHTNPITQAGQSIICLPNSVVVTLEHTPEDTLDSISY